MPLYQVTSISSQLAAPPKKRARRFPYQWYIRVRALIAGSIGGFTFAMLLNIFGHPVAFFIFLPIFVSLAWAQPLRYNISRFLSSAPLYLFLTICWTSIYYSVITVSQLLIYGPSNFALIIPVTSSLAWAIMLDPLRAYVQQHIERRFNLRDRKAAMAIEAFTLTLCEEIDLDQLREHFLTTVQQTMQPYSLTLWTRTSYEQPNTSSSLEAISIPADEPLITYILHHPRTLEVDSMQVNSPLLQALRLRSADALMPLVSQGELVGLLILGPHLKGERYSSEEFTLLDSLIPQVGPAMRVALLVQEQKEQVRLRERIEQERVRERERIEQEQRHERERIEQELHTARSIQHAFLPRDVPALAGWHFAPYYQPARDVGGDFYDFLPLEDGRIGLVIGDVSGKGIPAALLMATVHTMLRTAVQGTNSPGTVLERVNELLAAEIPEGMFVTCFFALLDPASGHMRYANAGHEPPYRQHEGNAAELWATGMPLGMLPGTRYDEYGTTLAPGDSLLFYSDGLVEAHNPANEMFGFSRLQQLLSEQTDAASLINVLLSSLQCFTGEGWEQEDDVTFLTVQRTNEKFASQNA